MRLALPLPVLNILNDMPTSSSASFLIRAITACLHLESSTSSKVHQHTGVHSSSSCRNQLFTVLQ